MFETYLNFNHNFNASVMVKPVEQRTGYFITLQGFGNQRLWGSFGGVSLSGIFKNNFLGSPLLYLTLAQSSVKGREGLE